MEDAQGVQQTSETALGTAPPRRKKTAEAVAEALTGGCFSQPCRPCSPLYRLLNFPWPKGLVGVHLKCVSAACEPEVVPSLR